MLDAAQRINDGRYRRRCRGLRAKRPSSPFQALGGADDGGLVQERQRREEMQRRLRDPRDGRDERVDFSRETPRVRAFEIALVVGLVRRRGVQALVVCAPVDVVARLVVHATRGQVDVRRRRLRIFIFTTRADDEYSTRARRGVRRRAEDARDPRDPPLEPLATFAAIPYEAKSGWS